MELLTPEELADRWKINRRTLDNWRSARIGPPYVKLGGRVRYDPEQCDAWALAQGRDGRGGAA
jgi:hypothetical protein